MIWCVTLLCTHFSLSFLSFIRVYLKYPKSLPQSRPPKVLHAFLWCTPLSSPPSRQPLIFLAPANSLHFLELNFKRNTTVYIAFWSGFSYSLLWRFVQLWCLSSVPFCCWVVFSFMDIPYMFWRTFESFALLFFIVLPMLILRVGSCLLLTGLISLR